MTVVTLLFAGFSIIAAVVLWFAYCFFLPETSKSAVSIIACSVLLLALSGLQLLHIDYLLHASDLFSSTMYPLLLMVTPPAFYLFSREVLMPDHRYGVLHFLHAIPLLLAFVVPPERIVPVAFAVGAGYAIWFTRVVHGMRRHVRRFRFEFFFFGFFAVVATAVLVLGLLVPYIDPAYFHLFYANLTGVAFALIVAALIIFPEITSDISAVAKLSYASSSLSGVDVEACLEKLGKLMDDQKLYCNEDLNLPRLAAELDLGSHQLSELINTRFGIGFSRYVRELRVAEARRLLRDDQSSSVLAIGLMTGFRSQSAFYAAFRELTGEAPGSWRKNRIEG